MTYAEQTAANGQRDDEHMIYEMFEFSQYSDGSVLECRTMTTYTAEEVWLGKVIVTPRQTCSLNYKMAKDISDDLKRNAKAALKNGTTKNRAPRV